MTDTYFKVQGQLYLAKLYTALFATAYYGLFRIGELTLRNHTVKACNVHIRENKRKIQFILYTLKTHRLNNHPQLVKIASTKKLNHNGDQQHGKYYPYALLRTYLSERGGFLDETEIFFIFKNNQPVLPSHFRKVLRIGLSTAGLDAHKYCGHSFRAGRSLNLLRYSLSVETIKKLGRW